VNGENIWNLHQVNFLIDAVLVLYLIFIGALDKTCPQYLGGRSGAAWYNLGGCNSEIFMEEKCLKPMHNS
jgi:hypothetical protein